jgi:hypothetical protein
MLSVLRPDDLLNLRVRCVNLRIETSGGEKARLMPASDADAFVVFTFPPQSITERAYYDAQNAHPPSDPDDGGPYDAAPAGGPPVIGSPDAPGNVPARVSGQSRLVFRLGSVARVKGIPLSIEGLLDWSDLELVVSPIADIPQDADATTGPVPPTSRRLRSSGDGTEPRIGWIISPITARSGVMPLTCSAWTVELWHTAVVRDAGQAHDAAHRCAAPSRSCHLVAGLQARSTGVWDDLALKLSAMAPYDRHQIVILTSDFHHYLTKTRAPYVPAPFLAEQLMLSPLGGWIKSRGSWDPPYARVPVIRFPDFPWGDLIGRLPRSVRIGRGRQPGLAEGVAPLLEALATRPPTSATTRSGIGSLPVEGVAIGGLPGVIDAVDIGGPWIILPELGAQLDLSEWVHVATQARDHYVRIVYEGRLYPFGHRAALIKITERKVRNFKLANGSTTPVAYMVQKMYIVVRERVRDFGNAAVMSLSHDGRAMPLKQVRLTRRSPRRSPTRTLRLRKCLGQTGCSG